MTFLVIITILVGLIWSAVLVRRGSVLLGCTLFLLVGYIFGHHFAHFRIGPVPLTIDRIFLVGLVIAAAWQWKTPAFSIKPWTATDWFLVALVGVLSASTMLNLRPLNVPDGGSPTWRLISSYWIPLALYWIAKQSHIDRRQLRMVTAVFGSFGIWLVVTAFAEITQQWWAVWPRYIADPTIGIHFGRARGPMLMAASMGIYLTVGGLALWYRGADGSRFARLGTYGLLALFVPAVFVTYTRSTWLGAAGAALIVLLFSLRGTWRYLAMGGIMAAAILIVPAQWDRIVSFQRDQYHTASDTRHSVHQRKSFAYVSWQMFKDHPIFGCGFGRFYDKKLPYLNDRRQPMELNSIRNLHHHNTILSVLTETGIVGLALFLAVLTSIGLSAWRMARASSLPIWIRRYGVFMLAVETTYLGSALFHDLSFSPAEHMMLFFFAGVTTSLYPRVLSSQVPVVRKWAPDSAVHAPQSDTPGWSVAT
ncbi:MAG: O-antigen ligase family protein [Pirellulales bacterium]|nr:O-antigen ligase family protein [Pirellulales bacterium]